MPQKLTTTGLFHPRFLLDETGCSGKFLRHFMTIRFHSFVFRKPKLSRLYIYTYIYIYIYI